MSNRQVRLDPDVVGYVEERAEDWDCSLSAATNLLIRRARDETPVVGEPVVEPAVSPTTALPEVLSPARRLPKGVNPRLNSILRSNAGR